VVFLQSPDIPSKMPFLLHVAKLLVASGVLGRATRDSASFRVSVAVEASVDLLGPRF
jgi:hypothetical protein